MKTDASTEPTAESLADFPEVDFTSAIRPNRYANLRGKFEHAVFLDRDLWAAFGSEKHVLEALRAIAARNRGSRPSAAPR